MSPTSQSFSWPFTLTLSCELQRLHELRRTLTEWLQTSAIPDHTRADVVLATHEAAANAIEHSGTNTGFTTRARIDDASILVEVHDTGRWKQSSLQAERGRGLALISRLTDKHEIDRHRAGTTIRMTHHIQVADRVTALCLSSPAAP